MNDPPTNASCLEIKKRKRGALGKNRRFWPLYAMMAPGLLYLIINNYEDRLLRALELGVDLIESDEPINMLEKYRSATGK